MATVRIIFASDFHGNEQVWRKFLNSAKIFKANWLIMGGDLTGKVLTPIVLQGDGTYKADFMDKTHIVPAGELENFKKQVREHCYIPYVCDEKQFEELQSAPQDKVEDIFAKLECETLKEWLDLIPKKLTGDLKDVKVLIHPGNDDKFELDDVIKNSPYCTFAEESAVSLDGEHEAACVGWSNPTPWNSPRECSEEELMSKLEKTVSQVKNVKNSLFCLHCPPFESQIDNAPKLDKDFRPVMEGGRPVYIPVGSKSVRAIIEKYQPLLGLHGHIHECRGWMKIGRTQCMNPGSEYTEGILSAYLIEMDGEKIKRLQRVEG
ncbi:MAG: metallophosphoesterase [Candidatus Bathyarchaeia archaeon]